MALLKVSLVVLAMVAAVVAKPAPGDLRNTYLPPGPGTPEKPPGPPTHEHDHHEPGMPFDFNYAVKDDESRVDQSHNAASDGDVVRGEYRVLLPDGRTQVVSYTADWKNGYNAVVTFEGTATEEPPKKGY